MGGKWDPNRIAQISSDEQRFVNRARVGPDLSDPEGE